MLAYTFYESDNRVIRYAETLVSQGHQVDVIALRRPGVGERGTQNGVDIYRIQKRVINESGPFSYLKRILLFFFRSAFLITRLHLRQPYDLIHVHSVPDFEVFAAVVPKLLGAKIILDIHDIVPEFFASKFKTGNRGIIYRMLIWVEKLSIAFSDHVIISNHLWEQTLISRSVRPAKCTTIINYPDPSIFFPRPRRPETNHFIILYPGSINWHQGLDIAVQAFNLIKDKVPYAILHIYGEGSHKEELVELIHHLSLESRVQVFDALPLTRIAEIMAAADLGVIPKRNDSFGGQAFSTKTLEFMSSNVPIVLSQTQIDDFYFNKNLVTFFEPENCEALGDTMLDLILDPDKRTIQAKNGLAYVQTNNWGVKSQLYHSIVLQLTQKAHPRESTVS